MSNYSYKYYRTDKQISGRIVRKVVSEFNLWNDTSDVTEIRYRYNGSTIIAYEEFQRVIFKPYVIRHIIRIGEKNSNLLGELDKLNKKYTSSSIINALGRTRALGYFIAEKKCYCKPEDRYYPVEFNAFRRTITLPIDSQTKTASDAVVERDLQMLTNLADRLWRDLNDLVKLNTSELEKKPKENNRSKKNEAEILNFVLKAAAKFGVAMVGGMLGAKLDLPDDGNTIDIDVDLDGDYDSDDNFDFSSDDDTNYDNGSSITFMGKNFKGYIDEQNHITVPTMGGGKIGLDVYSKPGSSYIYVSDGSCTPIPVTGDHITISHTNIKSSVIKGKV